MKANELMIDDWVYNKNIDKPMQIYPMIFSQMFRGKPAATTEDFNIFPIPLTTEIFEKNGFEKQWQDDCEYFDDDENLVITFHPKSSNYTNGAYDYIDIEKGCLTINEMPIAFVHELQHALRLCGIEKTIEL
ncbi:hypothetical protein L6472_05935 [Prevotella sp. E13-17]|uniref:hypothetical protein n=1 Tax=Prevotella sp. E13-17 TaxID=2913616 RepID=UPI001EDAB901|nr:hypothetical protein [Prevotella sp. E13-17]UKK52117.1 hypothetical protein L6472_05935 [Prevotella sp. E13-17]